jgi:hypothetical protein
MKKQKNIIFLVNMKAAEKAIAMGPGNIWFGR